METTLFYVIGGLVFLFALGVRQKLKSTYAKWSRVRSVTGKSGGQVARTILDANRLQSIPVQPVKGTLTDHYDPRRKQLRLAQDNFVGNSVAATAVSAHECGHALQDADDYRPMEFRTAMVPVANAGARFGLPLAIAGSFFGSPLMVQIGILGYVAAMLLTFLTLPVGGGGAGAQPAADVVAAMQTEQESAPPSVAELTNPLPQGRVTWTWGPGHRDPFTGEEVTHRGIDVAAPAGTEVIAPADGVVRLATETYDVSPASGTVVLLEHDGRLETFYAHLGSITVAAGQRVDRGEVIATVGSTGKSTGPHLHFEVRRDGEAVDPADFVTGWN